MRATTRLEVRGFLM